MQDLCCSTSPEGLFLCDSEETLMCLSGKDWDNACTKEAYYPVKMCEDFKRIEESSNNGNSRNRNKLGVTKLTLRFEDGSTIEYERE